MGDDERNTLVEFDRLNLIGKAVFLSGQAARAVGSVLEVVVDQAATLIVEAEKAFLDGLDGGIEDAKILEETIEDPKSKRTATR